MTLSMTGSLPARVSAPFPFTGTTDENQPAAEGLRRVRWGERAAAPPHKIIITGTGRAGTTFLVRLLTVLGQPTGYDRKTWQSHYSEAAAAGLEHDVTDPESPYIVKNPELCVTLPALLTAGRLVVDHAIIPIRDLESATLSRVRIGGRGGELPGGLIGTSDPARQRGILAERFHELVHALVVHQVPHTFLLFPRFAQDAEYAFAALSPLFRTVRRAEFMAAFRAVADPNLVHRYQANAPLPPPPAPDLRPASHRRHRYWRRGRRLATWSLVLASIAMSARLYVPGLRPAALTGPVPSAAMVAPAAIGRFNYRLWPIATGVAPAGPYYAGHPAHRHPLLPRPPFLRWTPWTTPASATVSGPAIAATPTVSS